MTGGLSGIESLRVVLAIGWLLTVSVAANDGHRSEAADYWPQWRGPLGTGAAPHADPPLEWSESNNLRWKILLPGRGHATPVVWGNRIFIAAAVPYGPELEGRYGDAPGAHDNAPVTRRHRFVVMAAARQDGKIMWQRTLREALPHEGGHYTASLASNSPVTDGESLFVYFGSRGLYCLELNGKLRWKADLGQMRTKHGHGEGSSPVLHGNTLVVNWDHEGQSFVAAFDKRTGQERWRVARKEVTSWATPIVIEHQGHNQVIISGTHRVRSYDLLSGEIIWECGGLSSNIVASPVAGDGMVYAGSSYEKRALLAIRLNGAQGDITGSGQVAWTRSRGTPYVPSPLLYQGSLYFLSHYQGILSRVNAKTGEDQPGPIRLQGIRNVYASPVGAAGRVYVTDRQGTTLVLSHTATPRVLAVNRLDDGFNASAALVDQELYLRGERNLYCITEE